MPQLTEQMYAHQQICIPPTFPYLLRQYAKAAIRTQPTDLLKWSTAYFRALALSLVPPVKPRLEYPITKTHFGLTPGWLKTLLRQLAGNKSVTWPLMVDRWHGACLEVAGLVEIILIAGFPDPADIPWLKFVATAAGFVTPNLTSTMILICELLTEEPEGGSAMIPAVTFLDLYKFLATLDASENRLVQNFYYTESNMDLTKREPVESTRSSEVDRSVVSEQVQAESEDGVCLCDDMLEEKDETIAPSIVDVSTLEDFEASVKASTVPDTEVASIATTVAASEKTAVEVDSNLMIPPQLGDKDSCYVMLDADEAAERARTPSAKEDSSEECLESSETISSEKIEEKEESIEDLGDVISYKAPPSHTGDTTTESSLGSEDGYVTIKLPQVPGIGGIVPPEMVDAVVKYIQDISTKQQGMAMPRNIRHFLCPPLEVLDVGGI